MNNNFTFSFHRNFEWVTESNIDNHWLIKLQKHLFILMHVVASASIKIAHVLLLCVFSFVCQQQNQLYIFIFIFNKIGFFLNIIYGVSTLLFMAFQRSKA